MTAPFWMAMMEGVDALPASRVRRLSSGVLRHFVDGGSLHSGVLSLGWQRGPMPGIVQSYSSAGSPYWASKGFLGLALPASHAVWTQRESALPIEERDVRHVLAAPRWLIDGRHDDGTVRLHNLGSDGHPTRDDPLYRRMLFTSATRPITASGLRDSDVTLEGATHRAARTATVGVNGGSATRALDVGGRHIESRAALRLMGASTLHAARLTGGVGLTGRVSGSAVVRSPDSRETSSRMHAETTGRRVTRAHGDGIRSSVHLLAALHPASAETITLDSEGVIDAVADGDDVLLCPAVRIHELPADVILVWQSDLRTDFGSPVAPMILDDAETHDDHVVLTVHGQRVVLRWSLSEPFAGDAIAQLIRRP
jgi:hypothetical protein